MNGSVQTAKQREKERISEVYSKIFTPRVGNLVEFTWQYSHYRKAKHYKVRGKVLFIGKDFYTIQLSKESQNMVKIDHPYGYAYVPDQVRIAKHYKRIRTVVEE